MKTIYKYEITRSGINSGKILMPEGAEILHAGYQKGDLFIWAKVDATEAKEYRQFDVFGTGWDIPEDRRYVHIGTVFEENYVWHIFESFYH